MFNFIRKKCISLYIIVFNFFVLINTKFAYATGNTTIETTEEFQENFNVLLNNLVVIFVNFVIGLTIIVGVIAFIVQLIKLNTFHNVVMMRERALRELLAIVGSTAAVTIAGLIFQAIFNLVTK